MERIQLRNPLRDFDYVSIAREVPTRPSSVMKAGAHHKNAVPLVRNVSFTYAEASMKALRRVLLPVAFATAVLASSFQATHKLPEQLSDAAFWQFATDSSEGSGSFISENFVSNELGFQYVIPAALERVQPGGVYMGVGPEQNFTYVAAFHPSIAFIVDIRRQNLIEHLLYKAIFELSSNRTEFLSRLFARRPGIVDRDAPPEELLASFAAVPQDAAFYRETLDVVRNLLLKKHRFALSDEDQVMLEHVYEEFAKQGTDIRYSVTVLPVVSGGFRVIDLPVIPDKVPTDTVVPAAPRIQNGIVLDRVLGIPFPTYAEVMAAMDANGKNWSFLATEENYRTIRQMQQNNLIVPLVGDFAGPKAIRAVGQYLKDHESTVSVFYISNVEQYLTPAPKLQEFYSNVAMLPLNASSTFIRSAQVQGVQPGLAQSSISSMQNVLDAVLDGRVRNWNDILRMSESSLAR
jgi:hypothetical protein